MYLFLILIWLLVQSISPSFSSIDKRARISIPTVTSEGKYKVIVKVNDTATFLAEGSWIQTVKIELDSGFSIIALEVDEEELDNLHENTNVLRIEPDYEVSILDFNNETNSSISRDSIPWGITSVLQNVEFFKNLQALGSASVCVADTGYSLGHPDLPSSYVVGQNGAGENWNFDGNGHGTHVSGTVCAKNNDQGVYGVIPHDYNGKFQHITAKAFDSSGSGSKSTVLAAVQACASLGANVISLSLGSPATSLSEQEVLDDYYYGRGILIIAAAGNGGDSSFSYPASYESVVSVASITATLQRSSFSQYNGQVEIAAPGSSVQSTFLDNAYQFLDGTSMATPHVAGVAGLLMMFFPQCTASQIRTVMAYTAQDLNSNGCDIFTGFGQVQAKSAYDRLSQGNCGNLVSTPNGGCYEITEQEASTNSPTKSPTPALAPQFSSTPTTAPVTKPKTPNAVKKKEKKLLKQVKKLKKKLRKQKKKLKKKLKKKSKKTLKKATSSPSSTPTLKPAVTTSFPTLESLAATADPTWPNRLIPPRIGEEGGD